MQHVLSAALNSSLNIDELSENYVTWMHEQAEQRRERLEKLTVLCAPLTIIDNARRMMHACFLRGQEGEKHLAELRSKNEKVGLLRLLHWLRKRETANIPLEGGVTHESIDWFKIQIAQLAIQEAVGTEMDRNRALESLRTRDYRAMLNEIQSRMYRILESDPLLKTFLNREKESKTQENA